MTAFDALMTHTRETQALGQVAGRLGWDQQTVMPAGSAHQRGEEMAAMEGVLHARRTDPRVAEWLSAVDAAALDDAGRAQLREISRSFERTQKVPADLAAALARKTTEAHFAWADARANDDFAAFRPHLEEVLALRMQEAEALAGGKDLYDALLEDYEPGMTGAELAAMFSAMRPELVALRQMALDAPEAPQLTGTFDEGLQMQISARLAQTFGYDERIGRIDKALHPFSSGSGQDVRITTRTSLRDPFNCFYSTIHEVGHATYEQNIDSAYLLTPLGRGVSMGVHESQSRIYENQLARSRAFTGWLFEVMRDAFGDFGVADADAFYACVNAVRRGFIRTEADELQYNLHVMLRFDLERAMLSGDLKVADLEAAWNDRFEADFGYKVDRASNGVLQDVHWSEGLMGYFPTYSLGNIYAGCLYQAMRAALPDLDRSLSRGDTRPALVWLRDNLQTHGGLRSPRDTITHACGGTEPTSAPLIGYLRDKFTGLYGN